MIGKLEMLLVKLTSTKLDKAAPNSQYRLENVSSRVTIWQL